MDEPANPRRRSPARRAVRALARVLRRMRLGRVVDVAYLLATHAVRRWRSRPGERRRRLRRLATAPLPYLYDVHPEARRASPREIGLRALDLDEIAGTAVGGAAQRGADFKPRPAFRSRNWDARWQRLRQAVDRLAILPPIDVVRYPPGGPSWVLDGHNRVAAALEVGQVGIDANVTELVLPDQNPSERPGDLAAALTGTRSLRAAAHGSPLTSVEEEAVRGIPPEHEASPEPPR